MDVKKLGRIPPGGGWKAHGRETGSTSERKKTKIGFDYIHSIVDDHTRLACSEIHDDECCCTYETRTETHRNPTTRSTRTPEGSGASFVWSHP